MVGTTTDADVFPARGAPENPQYNQTPYDLLIIGSNAAYDHFTSGSYTGRRGFRPYRTGQRATPTVKVTARWGYSGHGAGAYQAGDHHAGRPLVPAIEKQHGRHHGRA